MAGHSDLVEKLAERIRVRVVNDLERTIASQFERLEKTLKDSLIAMGTSMSPMNTGHITAPDEPTIRPPANLVRATREEVMSLSGLDAYDVQEIQVRLNFSEDN